MFCLLFVLFFEGRSSASEPLPSPVMQLQTSSNDGMLGQQPFLKELHEWVASFHDSEVVATVRTTVDGKSSVKVESVFLSSDEKSYIHRSYAVSDDGSQELLNIFAVLGESALAADGMQIKLGADGGYVERKGDSTEERICQSLNMFAVRHLFFRSGPVASDLLPLIDSADQWKMDDDGNRIVYSSTVGRHEFRVSADSSSPSIPSSLICSWAEKSGEVEYSVNLLIKILQLKKFGDVVLPSQVEATLSFDGLKEGYKVLELLELNSVKKVSSPASNWSDLLHEMPDGLRVDVSELPQIEFEWRGNEIVRKIDGAKLADVRLARFSSKSRIFILVALGVTFVVLFLVLRRGFRVN